MHRFEKPRRKIKGAIRLANPSLVDRTASEKECQEPAANSRRLKWKKLPKQVHLDNSH